MNRKNIKAVEAYLLGNIPHREWISLRQIYRILIAKFPFVSQEEVRQFLHYLDIREAIIDSRIREQGCFLITEYRWHK